MNQPNSNTYSPLDIQKRIGKVDMQQVTVWRQMTPAKRLDIAFQAYQFALDTVRLTECQRVDNISAEVFDWCVTRRMQGNQKLGREFYDARSAE